MLSDEESFKNFFFFLKCGRDKACQLTARENSEMRASTIVHIALGGGYYYSVLHSLPGTFISTHFRGKEYAVLFEGGE